MLGNITPAGNPIVKAAEHEETNGVAMERIVLEVEPGIVVPLVLQLLEMSHRIRHTIVPALLVLAGGFALRWVLVNAGQASAIVSAAAGQ